MRFFLSSVRNVAVGFVILTIVGGAALAQTTSAPGRNSGYFHGPGMMWSGGEFGGYGMFFGFFFMLLLLAAVVIGAMALLRYLDKSSQRTTAIEAGSNHDRALDILKERFAKGEIDAKEFAERKRHLAE